MIWAILFDFIAGAQLLSAVGGRVGMLQILTVCFWVILCVCVFEKQRWAVYTVLTLSALGTCADVLVLSTEMPEHPEWLPRLVAVTAMNSVLMILLAAFAARAGHKVGRKELDRDKS